MIEIVKCILKLGLVLYFGYKIKIVELSNDGNVISGLQLVLNYSNGDISIYTNGRKWFDNTDVMIHQNNASLSQSNGKLQMSSTGPIVIEGKDARLTSSRSFHSYTGLLLVITATILRTAGDAC